MFNKRHPSSAALEAFAASTTDTAPVRPTAAVSTVPTATGGAAPSANANSDGVVIIGKGTRIVGEITDASRVEIQGAVDGTIVADALIIREGGSLTGRLQASHAEVHGAFNGQLDIAQLLDIRATGTVEGELAYGKLAVAMGGHISGNVTNPRIDPSAQAAHYAREAETAASTYSYPSPSVAHN